MDLLLASILLNLLNLALPLAVLQVYDRILPRQAGSTLGLLLLGVVLALLLELGIRTIRSYITGWAAVRFEHNAMLSGFRRLLEADTQEYEAEGSSVYMERLRAAGRVRDFYSGQAVLAMLDLPFAGLFLALMWLIAGWLVLVPIVLLLLFIAGTVYNGARMRTSIDQRSRHDERRFSFIADALSGIHTIKAMALEAIMQRRYERLQETNVQQSFDAARHSLAAVSMGSSFAQLSTIGVAAFGAALVISGDITPGALAACIMLSGRSLSPLQSALSTWTRLQGVQVAKRQLQKVLTFPPAAQVGKPPLPNTRGELRMEHVGFRFDSGQTLFSGLDLSIRAGECIAIAGDSGTGKSTLLSLMCGVMTPSEGRVLLDGHDLAEHSPEGRYRHIAYVPQQGTLFNGTILENVTMFDQGLEEEAHRIAAELGLDRSVAAMRDGWETHVGNTAADVLPAGLRQRIAIARALLHQPQVVLFDEANIAIDRAGDEHLRVYLEKMRGKRTLVLVTHRPSLLKLADRVFAIRNGKLVPQEAQPAPAQQAGHATHSAAPSERPQLEIRPAAQLVSSFPVPTDLSMCLMALLTALEWRGSPRHLAEALPHFADTLDMTGFRQVMANLGFTTRSERTTLSNIDPRLLPCLFLPDEGDACVLLRAGPGGEITAFQGSDLEVGEMAPSGLRGEAHMFTRNEDAAAATPQRESWVRQVLSRFHALAWLGLVLSLGINVIGLAAPLFVMAVFNRVIPSSDERLIPFLAGGAALALGIEFVLRRLRGQVLSFVGARLDFIVGNGILQKLLALPAYSIETLPVGSQLSRIKDFENWRDLLVGPMALLFYDLPAAMIFVGVLAIINPWVLLVVALAGIGYVLLGVISRPATGKRGAIASRTGAAKQEFLADALTKMRAIRLAGAEHRWLQRFSDLSARYADKEFDSQQHASRVATLAHGISTLTAIGALATAVIAAFENPAAGGLVIVTMMIVWRLTGPLQHGFLSLGTIYRVASSMRQIDNLMRLRADRDINTMRTAPPPPRGEVSFARVSFRYSNDADPALLGVSLRVAPGQVAAIAGPNGAGKSTLVKLITGIYTPQAGSVRIDNVDIRQIEPGTLRSLISYMPQRCEVFYGTVAQNLRLVHPLATEDELRWAADMAGIIDEIMAMPQGFDTRLSDGKADQLPYGFRQRLGLARTYLRPAPVVLFDEPGNGLDNEGDMLFQRALEYLRGKATIFIVSHRPSHLKLADVVVLMEDGYCRQVGTYEQVAPLIMRL